MVSAPYLLRLHLDFIGAAAVPVPRGPSLILHAAAGGFTRSHRHLFQLAEGSAVRSGWIGAATASRTLLHGHEPC